MKRILSLAVPTLCAGLCASTARADLAFWPEALTSGAPARLAPFYEKTLGWTSETRGEGETGAVIFLREGRAVAGLSHHAAERRGPTRSRWLPVFAVSDPAATEASLLEAGGRAVEALSAQEPAGGATRWLGDAEGAVFGVAREPGGGAAPRGVWPVLLVRDTAGAAEFYRGLFGGRLRVEGRTPLFAGDFLLERHGRAWAGVQPRGSFGQAGWLVLFAVGDIEAATKTVRKEGGRILRAPELDLIGGRVAVLADPAGGVFGLYEALPLAAPERGGAKGQAGAAAASDYEVEILP